MRDDARGGPTSTALALRLLPPTHMRVLLIAAISVVSTLALADDTAKPSPKPKPEVVREELGRPDYLSDLARQILRRRMERHGKDMTHLMTGVVLLKRDMVEVLAQSLAHEPRITRPLPDAKDELNSALPEKFFVLQDELRDRAKGLAEAARSKDDKQLGESFARLTSTCIACHSAFLNSPKREDPK